MPPDCREVVRHLMARHDWQLVPFEELVQLTQAELAQGRAKDCVQAAKRVYTRARHQACSGVWGEARRERSYFELYTLLTAVATSRYSYLGEAPHDLAQDAIRNVYLRFAQCHNPQAFVTFAVQELRNVVKAIHRARPTVPITVGDDGEPIHMLVDPRPDLLDRVMAYEDHERLYILVQAFLQKHPSSRTRMTVLLLHYIDDLSVSEIATLLNTTPAAIHTRLSRIRDQLRDDSDWRDFAADL